VSAEWGIVLAVVGLIACGLAMLGLRALQNFSHSKLEELCGPNNAEFIELTKASGRLTYALDLWRAVGVGACCCGTTVWSMREGNPGIIAVFIVFAIGGGLWLPAAIGRLWPESIVRHGWSLWELAALVVTPFAWGARMVSLLVQTVSGRKLAEPTEETLEEEIRTMVSAGERDGLLEEEAREMIEGVFDLSDADVSQVMTPRTEIIAMSLDTTWDAVVKFAAEAGHTRIPVYDRNRDDIIGVLHIKDLLGEFAKAVAARRPWRELLRKPLLVPETKPVNELLQEFQRSRMLLAIVINEYGSVSGLITIEDVLEEIVGEIADEHDDHAVEKITILDDTHWEALAKIRIAELNEQLGLELPDEAEFDTLGGFVFHELGHIPHAGETLTWRNVRIRVLEATRRRIHRVALERIPEATEGQTEVPAGEKAGRNDE